MLWPAAESNLCARKKIKERTRRLVNVLLFCKILNSLINAVDGNKHLHVIHALYNSWYLMLEKKYGCGI